MATVSGRAAIWRMSAGGAWTRTVITKAAWTWTTTLVERCLSGDDAAWEDLVRQHTRRVYGLCYRFTGNDSEAQDLTQDVFLRVFRALGSFRSDRRFFHDLADPADPQPADRPLPPDAERAGHGFD